VGRWGGEKWDLVGEGLRSRKGGRGKGGVGEGGGVRRL